MQTILIVDDDDAVTEGLGETLQATGRELILCRDLESAQLVVERHVVACLVAHIWVSGSFHYVGIDFIKGINRASAVAPQLVMDRAYSGQDRLEAKFTSVR